MEFCISVAGTCIVVSCCSSEMGFPLHVYCVTCTFSIRSSIFPAILRSNPEVSLESINAQMYEVAATEPLHDIKGHSANLLEYTLPLLFGNMKMECEKIIATVLGKDTKRCCDFFYRLYLLHDNAIHSSNLEHTVHQGVGFASKYCL